MAGIDSSTVLMLHCDGADEATSFPDASDSGHTVTAADNAQVDTAQSKFGGACLLCDGTDDELTIPDSADWDFDSGDFTVDFWLRFNDSSADSGLYCQWEDGSRWHGLYYDADTNDLIMRAKHTGIDITITGAWTPNDDQWYHIAVVRSGNAFYLFVDGTDIVDGGSPDADDMPDCFGAFRIGYYTPSGGVADYWLNGWVDEFRVSKGTARWTASFTPPTEAYSRYGHAYRVRYARPVDRQPPHAQVW